MPKCIECSFCQVLKKLTGRLMKKWGFELEKAPNVYTAHLLSQMEFYIRKRYEEDSDDKDNMDELIHSLVVKQSSLKASILEDMNVYCIFEI